MSAITAARLRQLRADALEPGLPADEDLNRAADYVDAIAKAPRAVYLWSLLLDWRRYTAAQWDAHAVIVGSVADRLCRLRAALVDERLSEPARHAAADAYARTLVRAPWATLVWSHILDGWRGTRRTGTQHRQIREAVQAAFDRAHR